MLTICIFCIVLLKANRFILCIAAAEPNRCLHYSRYFTFTFPFRPRIATTRRAGGKGKETEDTNQANYYRKSPCCSSKHLRRDVGLTSNETEPNNETTEKNALVNELVLMEGSTKSPRRVLAAHPRPPRARRCRCTYQSQFGFQLIVIYITNVLVWMPLGQDKCQRVVCTRVSVSLCDSVCSCFAFRRTVSAAPRMCVRT